MQISFTFKNFEPSEHLSNYARRRMEKLGRFFGRDKQLEAQVNLSVDKFRQRVEAVVSGAGFNIAADEMADDMYTSIDLVLDKLEAQVKKHVSRIKENRRKARNNANIDIFAYDVAEKHDAERIITGRDHFSSKPMSPDEAAMQLETKAFSFLVFLNSENERINVIYKRKNEDFGLIDPML